MRKGEMLNVKGFVRAQVVDKKGRIVGDSGWRKNTVVNEGFEWYICALIGKLANSVQVAYMAIGTGTAPGVTATSLAGETGARVTTSNSIIASKTMQSTCQFAGSDLGAASCAIQNVALCDLSAAGTILCGTTYATSQWASNQNVKYSHQVMVTLLSKLLKFGETLFETIPSQAVRFLTEGVETLWEALERGEEKVRAIWRHIELGGNDQALW